MVLATAAEAITANTAPTATLTKQGAPSTKTGKVTGKVTASDPDGDKLTYLSPIATVRGTVTINAKGAFTYTPTAAARHAAAAVNGPLAVRTDTFNIVVSDGQGGVTSVPVTVAITPANTAPTAKSVVTSTNPVSGVVTGRVTVIDKDSDTPSFTVSGTPTRGVVSLRPDGSFSYTPAAEARSTARKTTKTDNDKFTVTVDDGHGSQKTVAVNVTIAPSDTAPVNVVSTIGSPNTNTGVIKGVVTANDNEGDALTFTGSTTTTKGKVIVSRDGTFTYTPTAAARHDASADTASPAAKRDTLTVNVVDKYGASTPISITVNILAKNAAPGGVKTKVAQTDNTTGAVTGTISVADADKDVLTYSGSATTGQGRVVVNANGTFTFTPTTTARAKAAAPDAAAADKQFNFTVTTNDGHGGITPIAVTVAISPNLPPSEGKYSLGQPNSSTSVVTGTVTARDPDGDKLTYTSPAATAKGSIAITAQGTFTYTPTAAARHAAAAGGAAAQDTFTVAVADGKGGITQVTVTVPILGANSAPAVGNTTFSVNQNTQLSGNVLANVSDPDGDPLTVGFVSGRDHGSLNLNANGSFTYSPVAGFSGTDSFTYTVSDGHGATSTATATITVNYVAPSGPTLSQKVSTFVSNTRGRTIANPDGSYAGQCVSLVRQYLEQALNIRTGAWGNAIDYRLGGSGGNQLASRGFTWSTDRNFQDGDILVFNRNDGTAGTDPNGHIGIWSAGQFYDQNDGWRSNASTANYSPFDNTAPSYGGISHAFLGYWRPPGGGTSGGGTTTPGATSGTKSGTAMVKVLVNVRNDPSTNGPIIAQYSPGQTFNYDSWVIANGFYWVSYVSYSGVRRYVAESTLNGSVIYLSGGVFH